MNLKEIVDRTFVTSEDGTMVVAEFKNGQLSGIQFGKGESLVPGEMIEGSKVWKNVEELRKEMEYRDKQANTVLTFIMKLHEKGMI